MLNQLLLIMKSEGTQQQGCYDVISLFYTHISQSCPVFLSFFDEFANNIHGNENLALMHSVIFPLLIQSISKPIETINKSEISIIPFFVELGINSAKGMSDNENIIITNFIDHIISNIENYFLSKVTQDNIKNYSQLIEMIPKLAEKMEKNIESKKIIDLITFVLENYQGAEELQDKIFMDLLSFLVQIRKLKIMKNKETRQYIIEITEGILLMCASKPSFYITCLYTIQNLYFYQPGKYIEQFFQSLLAILHSLDFNNDNVQKSISQMEICNFILDLSVSYPNVITEFDDFFLCIDNSKYKYLPLERLFLLVNFVNRNFYLKGDKNVDINPEKWTKYFQKLFIYISDAFSYSKENTSSSLNLSLLIDMEVELKKYIYGCALDYSFIKNLLKTIDPSALNSIKLFDSLMQCHLIAPRKELIEIFYFLINNDYKLNHSIHFKLREIVDSLDSLKDTKLFLNLQSLFDFNSLFESTTKESYFYGDSNLNSKENLRNELVEFLGEDFMNWPFLDEVKQLTTYMISLYSLSTNDIKLNKYEMVDSIYFLIDFSSKIEYTQNIIRFKNILFMHSITYGDNVPSCLLIYSLLQQIPIDFSPAPNNLLGVSTPTCLEFHSKCIMLAIDLLIKEEYYDLVFIFLELWKNTVIIPFHFIELMETYYQVESQIYEGKANKMKTQEQYEVRSYSYVLLKFYTDEHSYKEKILFLKKGITKEKCISQLSELYKTEVGEQPIENLLKEKPLFFKKSTYYIQVFSVEPIYNNKSGNDISNIFPNTFSSTVIKDSQIADESSIEKTFYYVNGFCPDSRIMHEVVNKEVKIYKGEEYAYYDISNATERITQIVNKILHIYDVQEKVSDYAVEDLIYEIVEISKRSLSGNEKEYQRLYVAEKKSVKIKNALKQQENTIIDSIKKIKPLLSNEMSNIIEIIECNCKVALQLLYEAEASFA